jgi:hypothetical protein
LKGDPDVRIAFFIRRTVSSATSTINKIAEWRGMVHTGTSGEHSHVRSAEVSPVFTIFPHVVEALTIVNASAHLRILDIVNKVFPFRQRFVGHRLSVSSPYPNKVGSDASEEQSSFDLSTHRPQPFNS